MAVALLSANFIAEYLLAVTLAAGVAARRWTEGMSTEEAAPIWLRTAQELQNISARTLALCGNVSEEKAGEFLDKIVSVERNARQMQFWMTDEYIEPLLRGEFPEDIYGEGVWKEPNPPSMTVPRYRIPNFQLLPAKFREHGFSMHPGETRDLAGWNGACPLQEMEKGLHAVAAFSDVFDAMGGEENMEKYMILSGEEDRSATGGQEDKAKPWYQGGASRFFNLQGRKKPQDRAS